jgi:hypothetical protein
VAGSSFQGGVQFKSPRRVVVRFLLRSRERATGKLRKLREGYERARREIQRLIRQSAAMEAVAGAAAAQVRRLECEQWAHFREAARTLPPDPPVGPHGYGARMVELSVRLAQAVGFRPAVKVMNIFFAWLGVTQRVPHATAIRNWLQRLGVAVIQEPLEQANDWVWMADHSNQIGQEKILVVLAVRASQLPPPGSALRLEDMRALAVQPGKCWKREDVARAYEELAKVHGAPRQVLSDGAVELRESVVVLKAQRSDCITLQDFKHKAANFLETALGESSRFSEFTAQVGRTRAAIQQTELAHLTPPGLKTKARFMNLGTLLNWGQMVLWLLDHPEAKSRQGLTDCRLESKLGWLREFTADLAAWNECQKVIQRGLEFVNTQGVSAGASDRLRVVLVEGLSHSLGRDMAERLITFVKAAESQLKEGERLPLSTEILESSFARYKQLEGQHAKGGFTSLVAAFAGLLLNPTPSTIKAKFSRVSTKHVKQWLHEHLDQTVTSKRVATYREMKQASKSNTMRGTQRATKTTTTS